MVLYFHVRHMQIFTQLLETLGRKLATGLRISVCLIYVVNLFVGTMTERVLTQIEGLVQLKLRTQAIILFQLLSMTVIRRPGRKGRYSI